MKSWIEVAKDSDFSIHNIPFGIVAFNGKKFVASRIGNSVINLAELHQRGYFENIDLKDAPFSSDVLNPFIEHGKEICSEVRMCIIDLFADSESTLTFDEEGKKEIIIEAQSVEMCMPLRVGDYTDFYSSIEHATNVGKMFRDPENALLPNWKHLPVGYHGRSSSIIPSGIPIHRPKGQMKPNDSDVPVFGPCKLLDFELEMAFVTYPGKALGDSISTEEADDYIFGMCLFNDWSARDIQKWEYVPLGPFLAKNFASSIAPWIVTLEALEPFRVKGPVQDPKVLPYLEYEGDKNIDIQLEVFIQPEGGSENKVSASNYKHMYWTMNQQLAHHTVNGCDIHAADMYASGTISGPTPDSYGSMLEISWQGKKSFKMNDGTERKFIQDGDTVIMRGFSDNGKFRVGFGEVSTKVLPAKN